MQKKWHCLKKGSKINKLKKIMKYRFKTKTGDERLFSMQLLILKHYKRIKFKTLENDLRLKTNPNQSRGFYSIKNVEKRRNRK